MTEYIVEVSEWVIDANGNPPFGKSEPIVRCRDCKHYTYADKEHGNNDWCEIHDHIAWSVNGFCAWGKKKE